jgi:hypothetical protein
VVRATVLGGLPGSACGLLGGVAEPLQQFVHVRQLALEVLLIALKPLDQLLAIREAAPAKAAKAAAASFMMMSFTHMYSPPLVLFFRQ